jgi:hypothetical protein
MNISTDNRPRALLAVEELPLAARRDFDYITADELDVPRLVKFRGNYYDVHETMVTHLEGWDSAESESAFSAVLFRLTETRFGDPAVVVGYAYS